MMNYIVNVTKQTFEAFASHPHNPLARWRSSRQRTERSRRRDKSEEGHND